MIAKINRVILAVTLPITLGLLLFINHPGAAKAQSYLYYNSSDTALYNDFNGPITLSSDYCIGQWESPPALSGVPGATYVNHWVVNSTFGYQCPATYPNATIDLFAANTNGLPNNVYYSSINIYTSYPWAGTIELLQSDLHISPSYYVLSTTTIQNTYSPGSLYTRYLTQIPVNSVLTNTWGIRYTTDNSCPQNMALLSSVGCPAITEIQVSYQAATPVPSDTSTNTIPPSWTIAPTITPYGTGTEPPGYPTPTPYSTLAISTKQFILGTRSIGINGTPTDYPCNAGNYIYQGNNNLGTPCGSVIQFATLSLPIINLPSPTLYVVATNTAIPITATPSITPTPTITPTITVTPSPTPTGAIGGIGGNGGTPFSIDTSGITNLSTNVANSLGTLAPLGNLSVAMNGTQVGAAGLAQSAGNAIGGAIVFARTLQLSQFDAGGLITLGISVLIFIVAVQVFVAIFPLILYILRLILQVVQTILTPF
jgi:hypothetical protein